MRACIKTKKLLGYAAGVGFGAIATYFVYQSTSSSAEGIVELANAEYTAKHLAFVIPITIIIAAALFIGIFMLSEKTAKKLLVPCIVCGSMLALMFAGIQGCKLLWGRVRMRQLVELGDLSRFTPWYKISPFSGFRSFPSGHTANAVSLGLLPLLYSKNIMEKSPYAKKVTYIFVAVWGAFMAFTRILVGAHFLSDVLCGAAIAFVCVILGHYFMDKIRNA
jgi:membrane-associated phospholipid phosphatase